MDQETKSPYLIPGSILVAGVIIAFAIVYGVGVKKNSGEPAVNSQKQAAAVGGSAEAKELLEDPRDGRILGNPQAPVSFVEFGDFQCPFCGRFYSETEKQLIDKYVKIGKVKFIWRDFAFLGEESFRAAEASRCAGEQNKFWDYHDYLFENQQGENRGAFSDPNLKSFAGNLGLDESAFSSCIDSGKYRQAVEEESSLGRELGVTGTPSSFVNGRQVTGALPFSQFEILIQQALEDL